MAPLTIGRYRTRQLLAREHGKRPKYPPVFVLGPPRCGSTLFYQAMITKFHLCYFQNRMMEQPFKVPLVATRKEPGGEGYRADFVSDHGSTRSPMGPHEGFPFWRRFYPRKVHDYVATHSCSQAQAREMIATVAFLTRFFDAPFFAKNLEMSLRLKSLQVLFPEACFLTVKRDPRAIAASILNARRTLHGDEAVWWSMRPQDYASWVDLPYAQQIAWQVRSVYETIVRDLEVPQRSFSFYYEDFCQDPASITDEVAAFLESHRVPMEKTGQWLPDRFEAKKTIALNERELEAVERVFSEPGFPDLVSYRVAPL